MKAVFLEKRAEAGMGGPNIGTFFDREMAILKKKKMICFVLRMSIVN